MQSGHIWSGAYRVAVPAKESGKALSCRTVGPMRTIHHRSLAVKTTPIGYTKVNQKAFSEALMVTRSSFFIPFSSLLSSSYRMTAPTKRLFQTVSFPVFQMSSRCSCPRHQNGLSLCVCSPAALHRIPNEAWLLSVQRRTHSSFIKQVMEQVRKELETNEELKKSMKDFQESKVVEGSFTVRDQARQAIDQASSMAEVVSLRLLHYYAKLKKRSLVLYGAVDQMRDSSPGIKAAMGVLAAAASYMRTGLSFALDGVSSVLEHFKDEKVEAAKQRAERWRMETERRRAQDKRRAGMPSDASDNTTDFSTSEKNSENGAESYALVVSEESAWERFGTTLRDMPFLQNFFDNPTLGKLFGESAQAAALREMKALDPTFKLPEFVELTEHVIAPHLLHSFLHGDREALRIQCREAAFAAVDQSIKERELLKLSLDPTVLVLRNVEFRGAAKMPDSDPWFIFTFTAQQINCLRDAEGTVVIGAVDDIREVTYSVALKRHPEPDTEGLEYPWQVAEFAVIGNTPCW